MELETAIEGTVVITADQTAGRGQRGNAWESEPGKNITCSVLVKPVFLAVQDQFWLTVVASLAVYDTLLRLGIESAIKWPNDLMVGDKKIAGILIENQISGTVLAKSVIGIGLNVNQQAFSVSRATSVYLCVQKETALPVLFESLMECFEHRYWQLRQNKKDVLKHEYVAKLYWRNEVHTFSVEGRLFNGVLLGVDASGKLMVERDKKIHTFDLKEIVFIK
jgi:BirA family biotin operon repressor/biotin-[acetyl-CoA-carboxylase] ligase